MTEMGGFGCRRTERAPRQRSVVLPAHCKPFGRILHLEIHRRMLVGCAHSVRRVHGEWGGFGAESGATE